MKRHFEIVSVHKWPFSTISASIGGIACAAYASTPPRNSLISLNLRKIAHFWIGNSSVPKNEIVDGHEISSRCKHILVAFAGIVLLLMSTGRLTAMECIQSEVLGSIAPAGVDQPSDVAIGPQGRVYLVDGVNNRIVVTDADGKPQFSFGRGGGGAGELQHPLGIDISKQGQVFIADTGNHRIQVFDPQGGFLYMFPLKTAPGEKPAAPVDVLALDRKSYLYISDRDNHKIRVHQQKGAFVFEWGGYGEVRGRFRYPGILAANQYNQIFVVDVLNTRIQEFDPDGNFINEIGTWGVSPGQLFRPKGVAVDKADRVFISDSFMGCVQVFTDLGGFLGVVCADGTKRNFTTPVGIAFDAENRLLVVEMRANAIRILKVSE
jgi:DNA-binding beta-propeller fold protein YncE